jgi:UDP-glucose-4-epimerase GalE
VGGALTVLEAMAAESVSHFVFSSTCATYGEPREMPIPETHPQAPINSYGDSKLAVERALPHFERACGIRWVALRYFNAAGADPDGEIGEDHSPEIHLIPRAIDAATGGQGLTVFGDDYPTPDGTCLRDYIHVSDLADAHVKALQRIASGGASGAYNLGTGTPHSVRAVIDAVERVTGKRVPWTLGPRRAGDPAALYAAPGKARTELGWTPQFADLDAIVGTAWRWHQSHPHGYRSARA